MFAVPPADVVLDEIVHILRDRLRLTRVTHVYVIAETCAGERDPRVGVARHHPDVCVELLCDQEDGTTTSRWHAVRITPHDRCVWRGPARGCDTCEVVRFVDDLLKLDPAALAGRYDALC